MNAYTVTVTYDPTSIRAYRWSYVIYDPDGHYVWSDTASSQGKAERSARRQVARRTSPGGYSYSFSLPAARDA